MSDGERVVVSRPLPGVRLVELNEPRIHNAMTEEMRAEWDRVMDDLMVDSDARCVVVTGRGESFCSGADLSWLDQAHESELTPDKVSNRLLPFYRSWMRLLDLPCPTIAAINGATIGAGLALALCCELRYASRAAVFSAPFLHLGTHPGIAVTYTLAQSVGQARALEMFYTGREVGAEDAAAWGLVLDVVDDVVASSIETAGRIAMAAPIATRLFKRGMARDRAALEAASGWEALAQPITLATRDLHEGIRARMEHRAPAFEDE